MTATAVLPLPAAPRTATDIRSELEEPLPVPRTPTYSPLDWLELPGNYAYLVGLTSPASAVARPSTAEAILQALERGFEIVATPTSTPLPTIIDRSRSLTRAVDALDTVQADLGITLQQVAEITGIGRTTLHYWKRTNSDPRPSTVKPLWRLHALGRAVAGTLGHDGAMGWLRSGVPTPLDLLLRGDFATVEERAGRWLFSQPELRRQEPALELQVEPESPPSGRTAPSARSSGRRRRR